MTTTTESRPQGTGTEIVDNKNRNRRWPKWVAIAAMGGVALATLGRGVKGWLDDTSSEKSHPVNGGNKHVMHIDKRVDCIKTGAATVSFVAGDVYTMANETDKQHPLKLLLNSPTSFKNESGSDGPQVTSVSSIESGLALSFEINGNKVVVVTRPENGQGILTDTTCYVQA